MSAGQDDCAPPNGKTYPAATDHDTEPADPPPDACDDPARRELSLAPPDVKASRLPDPLVDSGKPLTVAEAGETYLKVQRANWKDDTLTSKYERHKSGTYRQILDADRHFQAEYDDVTTAMLTRRLSPLDDTGSWLTPWECNEMLHGGGVHRSVREAFDYHLGGFEFEWLAVTSPTHSAGTPHEHIYLWIDDPGDKVTADHLTSALDKHLKHCTNAYEENHRYRTDGTNGAITVRHDPDLIKPDSERFPPHTTGAQYLASQLAHLPVGDYYSEQHPNPPQPLFEGAALAWASPRDWFRASRGVPA